MIQLRAHQTRAVEKARTQKHRMLWHGMGTGKTATAIRILAEDYNAHKRMRPTLIFAPLSVCPGWAEEFQKFSKIPSDRILVLTGDGKKRVKALLEQRQKTDDFVVVTNYESSLIKDFYKHLLDWSPQIIVADEVHRLKDPASKRAKAIYVLAQAADRRFGLTGTPIVASLLDIFGQCKFLDPSLFGPGFWSFRSRYFYDRNAGRSFSFPDWVPHPWAAQEIADKLAGISCQAKLEDVVDMPPLINKNVFVELSKEQARAYAELKKDFVTSVKDQTVSVEFAMVASLRLQQILAGFIQPDDAAQVTWFEEQPRLDALMDQIDSVGTAQFLVWAPFKPLYGAISKRLDQAKIAHGLITGEQTATQKQQVLADFKQGRLQAIVSNPSAGGTGLNLQEARYAFYYAKSYSLTDFLQSQARNFRVGTEKLHASVVHTHFVAKGTLDQEINRALLAKENIGRTLLAWARSGN